MPRKARTGSTPRMHPPHRLGEPEAPRLTVPGCEFSAKKSGLLPWQWAADRLKKKRQYWIATAGGKKFEQAATRWVSGRLGRAQR